MSPVARPLFSVALVLALTTSAAMADTIYLKNGSVIKGKVASYADDQFIVVLNTGSDRGVQSRATIYSGDVSRIEFDSEALNTETGVMIGPSRPQPNEREKEPPVKTTDTPTEPVREPEQSTVSTPPTTDPDPTRSSSSRRTPGQTTVVDVAAKRDWTSTGLIVKRGERIKVTATGAVTLDPTTGQLSGPEGIDQPDPKKLMADRPTGALIAVIGADNDDFIFIGRSAEFPVTRDGLLFLSVNEGTLTDNSGSYKATIERQARSTGR
jgi:sRNA-binding regulator protein Hfq